MSASPPSPPSLIPADTQAPAADPGELNGRHILLGVTGGVAAFKACELARELQRRGATVQVVMTEAATRFIGTATFQALTGRPVYTDAWDTRIANGMAVEEHVIFDSAALQPAG
jgi:hypothetical protein